MPVLPDGSAIQPVRDNCGLLAKNLNYIYQILDDIQENCCDHIVDPNTEANFYIEGSVGQSDVGSQIKAGFAGSAPFAFTVPDPNGIDSVLITTAAELSTYAASLTPAATVNPSSCAITYADGSLTNIPICVVQGAFVDENGNDGVQKLMDAVANGSSIEIINPNDPTNIIPIDPATTASIVAALGLLGITPLSMDNPYYFKENINVECRPAV